MSYRQQGYRPQPAPPQKYQPKGIPQDPYSQSVTYRAPLYDQPKKKKRQGRSFRLLIVLVLFALLATLGGMGYRMYDTIDRVERENTFYPGIYINGYQLYGHTPQEVFDSLTQKIKNELSVFQLELIYGDQNWLITRNELGMTDEAIDLMVGYEINNAFSIGRDRRMSMLERYQVIQDLKVNPYQAYISDIEKKTTAIEEIISQISELIYIEPKNAEQLLDYTKSNPLTIIPEVYGLEMDQEQLNNMIQQKVNDMQSGVIQVPTKPIIPVITAELLSNNMAQIAKASTTINKRSSQGRINNIERGCELINQYIIQPGKIFSFNTVVGSRTLKNGFSEAEEIVSGQYETGVGGGICQVSTTLYHAVIQAGLEVIERQNHGIPVNYVNKGEDATVSDGRIDFRFKNNTDAPIYIVAKVVNDRNVKTCEIQFLGRPDPNHYTYTFRHEEEIIPIPEEPERIQDKKQTYVKYVDQTHEVPGKVGYKVETYLIVRTTDGAFVEEKYITTDTYKPVRNRIYYGVDRR